MLIGDSPHAYGRLPREGTPGGAVFLNSYSPRRDFAAVLCVYLAWL